MFLVLVSDPRLENTNNRRPGALIVRFSGIRGVNETRQGDPFLWGLWGLLGEWFLAFTGSRQGCFSRSWCFHECPCFGYLTEGIAPVAMSSHRMMAEVRRRSSSKHTVQITHSSSSVPSIPPVYHSSRHARLLPQTYKNLYSVFQGESCLCLRNIWRS